MFSNKLYFVKIAIALSAVTWLSYSSGEHFSEKHPHFYQYLALSEESHNKIIGTDTDKVVKIDYFEKSFQIEEEGFVIKVKGATEMPSIGDFVSMWARFDKSGFLQPLPQKMVIHKNYKFKRGLMYGISIAVISTWLFYFIKVFKPNLHKGFFVLKGG